jgi:hypothetical protein
MNYEKLISELVDKKAEQDNQIDLNAYENGMRALAKQLKLYGVVFNEADIVNDNSTLNKHKKSWKAPQFDLNNSEVELCDHPKNYSREIEGTLVCEKCGGTYL